MSPRRGNASASHRMASLAMPTVTCPSQNAASACTSVAGAGAPDLCGEQFGNGRCCDNVQTAWLRRTCRRIWPAAAGAESSTISRTSGSAVGPGSRCTASVADRCAAGLLRFRRPDVMVRVRRADQSRDGGVPGAGLQGQHHGVRDAAAKGARSPARRRTGGLGGTSTGRRSRGGGDATNGPGRTAARFVVMPGCGGHVIAVPRCGGRGHGER